MGVGYWKGIAHQLDNLVKDLVLPILHVYSVELMIYITLNFQLPYEHLTPLQAAVGVVQKVKSNSLS